MNPQQPKKNCLPSAAFSSLRYKIIISKFSQYDFTFYNSESVSLFLFKFDSYSIIKIILENAMNNLISLEGH